jgi:hypothetical protein
MKLGDKGPVLGSYAIAVVIRGAEGEAIGGFNIESRDPGKVPAEITVAGCVPPDGHWVAGFFESLAQDIRTGGPPEGSA